jgi:D-amino-acid dehydrogenase
MKHFTVLGAGIVGVCSALALQREGWRVTLIDRDAPGQGCSFGNAGILHSGGVLPFARPGILGMVPRMLFDRESALVLNWRYLGSLAPWFARFLWASRPSQVERASRALAPLALGARAAYDPLLREAGAQDLLRPRGELYAYRTREGFEAERADMNARRALGLPVEELNQAELHALEPAIAPDYRYAWYQPASAYIANPARLVQRLVALFTARGGEFRSLDVRSVSPTTLLTDHGSLEVENLVICAGAHSRAFAAALGCNAPLQTWRGYHIVVPSNSVPLNGLLVDGDMHFAVTPMEDGIRAAGLVEFASLEAPPNYDRADLFLKLGRRLLPDFPREAQSRWMGHRPGMPDSVPVIGRSPTYPNVYFNFGHGTLGLTFGPITGGLLADVAAGRRGALDPDPYDPARYAA